MKYRLAYIHRIADWLQTKPSQIELYWKGRVGLYAILKAFGIKKNDEVILPAFTCVVVPNAVIYCGAKPVYVDIDATTLNTTLALLKSMVTPKTKVIIIQNTFGLSNQVEEIVAFAKENNILTIEDCTHGFGGDYDGKPNGSYCDAAFYSTQWNKPFSTGISGFAVMNNVSYLEPFQRTNDELDKPAKKDRYILASLIQARKYLLHDSTYWAALKLYRRLSKSGVVVGSSKGEELTGTEMPNNYFLSSVKVQEKVGDKALQRLPEVLKKRKEIGEKYNAFFRDLGKWNYKDEDLLNHSFLNYPIFVKDKESFKLKAEKAKIRLGDWFLSPIHPVLENFELWNIAPEDFPIANEKSKHILNLPTDTDNIQKVLDFLEKNKEDLM
jgi:perosamine synthetase